MILNIIGTIILWNLLMAIIHQKYKWSSNRVYCGLIGFSGKGKMNLDKIRMLMFWNAVDRGKDSTGIYSPLNGVIKTTDAAWKFLVKETIKEDSLFIGHVRASTVGATSTKNAHPFEEGDVVLAHNGTLTNYYAIAQKYEIDTTKYHVDSHIMAAAFNKAQNLKPLSEFDGAAAFLITNKQQSDVLYAFTNGQRPLFKGIIDGDMYISSIEDSLKMIGCIHIKEFKKDVFYTIKNGILADNGKRVKSTPIKYVAPVSTSHHMSWVQDLDLLEKMNIQANRSCVANSQYGSPLAITNGNFYFVVEAKQSKREFVIVDDTGKERTAPGYFFDYHDSILEPNCYIKVLKTLTTINKLAPEVIFGKGDIIKIVNVNFHNHTVSAYSTLKKKFYNLDFEYVRRLTKLEEAAHIMLLNPPKPNDGSSVQNNIDFLNDVDEDPDFPTLPQLGLDHIETNKDIVLNDDTSLENEEDDEEDEGPEFVVLEKELHDCFDDIYQHTEEICQYGNIVIPDQEYRTKFNKLTMDLQGKLMGYVDQFTANEENIVEEESKEEDDEELISQNHE